MIDYTIKNRHIKNGENIVLARYVTNGHMFNNKPVEINNTKQKTSIFEMLNTFFWDVMKLKVMTEYIMYVMSMS